MSVSGVHETHQGSPSLENEASIDLMQFEEIRINFAVRLTYRKYKNAKIGWELLVKSSSSVSWSGGGGVEDPIH